MKCPNCDTVMKIGHAAIKPTFKGFLIFGLSFKHLFFKSERTGEKEIILKNDKVAKSYKCPNCEVFVIYPNAKGPITYF